MQKNSQTVIDKLEKGRADFAYRCVEEVIKLESENEKVKEVIEKFKEELKEKAKEEINGSFITEFFKDPEKFLKEEYEKLKDKEKKVVDKYKDLLKNYRSYSRRLPSMILSNGLGQTLAFVHEKKKGEKNAYAILYNQLTAYMKSNSSIRIPMPSNGCDLLKWVISCNSEKYRYITQELLAFLNWLRRFAEGLIEESE